MMPGQQVCQTRFFAAPDAVYGVLATPEAAGRLGSDLSQLGFGETQPLSDPEWGCTTSMKTAATRGRCSG